MADAGGRCASRTGCAVGSVPVDAVAKCRPRYSAPYDAQRTLRDFYARRASDCARRVNHAMMQRPLLGVAPPFAACAAAPACERAC